MLEDINHLKTLYLVQNPELIRTQLAGRTLKQVKQEDLIHNVSTDAIIPSRYCYQDADPQRLGSFFLTGLSNQAIEPESIRSGGFNTIVAGTSFGRGSSREHAQLAAIGAGVRQFVVGSAETIFHDNCLNYGIPIYPFNNDEVSRSLNSGLRLPFHVYFDSLPPISQLISSSGGLIPFIEARRERKLPGVPEYNTSPRPMTMAEKILATHAGVDYTRPGQQIIVVIDSGYTYELQTQVTDSAIQRYFPEGVTFPYPEKFYLFEDHLALLSFPETDAKSTFLRSKQRAFAEKYGLYLYEVQPERGVEGICHTVMVEKHCLPGELVLGNDSHTCSLGVNGALAIGKGASEMGTAMVSGELIVTVPETININLINQLHRGVTSKDVMLFILGKEEFRSKLIGSGKVFEYSGPGLNTLTFDDQRVLTNMAIEGQALTGIIAPNYQTFEFLQASRGLSIASLRALAVCSDPDAEYFDKFILDLSKVEPMISLPGDTQNSIPLTQLDRKVDVNIAYIGSCTGGNLEDLARAAKTLKERKIHPNVRLFVQASSQSIREKAKQLGYFDVFTEAGATILPPGCGACMGAGPGSSERGEVTISDTNRNFYGRMGLGETYLASPYIVAASAIKGYISAPDSFYFR